MGKKFDETLKYLGSDYDIANYDFEKVIHRKIGEYDIGISGLNSRGTRYDISIYIWKNHHQIRSIHGICSKEELSKHLETVVQGLLSHQD